MGDHNTVSADTKLIGELCASCSRHGEDYISSPVKELLELGMFGRTQPETRFTDA
jgi:hypothetical protein